MGPGFYFSLLNRPSGVVPIHAYYSDHASSEGFIRESATPTMMEAFSTAGHAMTTGYEIRQGRWCPIFGSKRLTLRFMGDSNISELSLDFCYCTRLREKPSIVDIRPMIASLVQKWWMYPEQDQARAWGAFPFENDQVGREWKLLASPYRLEGMFSGLRSRLSSPPVFNGMAGRLVRSHSI